MRRKRTTLADQHKPRSGNSPRLPDSHASGVAPPSATKSRRPVTLAGRIMSWSGNLLATCVIVILGLTFGKHVLQWWHDDPPAVSAVEDGPAAASEALADPSLPHLLAFGDLPFIFDRQVFVGDEAAALAQLRASCRALAVDFGVEGSQTTLPVNDEILRRLEKLEPVEHGRRWRIVQNGGPVITVVALRMAPQAEGDSANVASQNAESVVSWGLGFRAPGTATEDRASGERWTLFTCSGRTQSVDSDLQSSLPIPPGCRRTLGVRVKGGGALVGFAGPRTAALSRQFFDQAFGEREWTRATDWTTIGASWHAHFEKSGRGNCDVQIIGDANGETSGILTLTTVQDAEK